MPNHQRIFDKEFKLHVLREIEAATHIAQAAARAWRAAGDDLLVEALGAQGPGALVPSCKPKSCPCTFLKGKI